jgi:3-oxoacyl-(acyl-carrier-protein) synthase/acyl carrier protein
LDLDAFDRCWCAALQIAPHNGIVDGARTFEQQGGDSLALVRFVAELRANGIPANFGTPWLDLTINEAKACLTKVDMIISDPEQHNLLPQSPAEDLQVHDTLFICGPLGDFRSQLKRNICDVLACPGTELAAQTLHFCLAVIRKLHFSSTPDNSSMLEYLLVELQRPQDSFRSPAGMFSSEASALMFSILNHVLAFCQRYRQLCKTKLVGKIRCEGHCIGVLSSVCINAYIESGRICVFLHEIENSIKLANLIGSAMDAQYPLGTSNAMYPLEHSRPNARLDLADAVFPASMREATSLPPIAPSFVPGTRTLLCAETSHVSVLSAPGAFSCSRVLLAPDALSASFSGAAVFKHAYHSPANIKALSKVIEALSCQQPVLCSFSNVLNLDVAERLLCRPFNFVQKLHRVLALLDCQSLQIEDLGPAQGGPGSLGIMASWAADDGDRSTKATDLNTGSIFTVALNEHTPRQQGENTVMKMDATCDSAAAVLTGPSCLDGLASTAGTPHQHGAALTRMLVQAVENVVNNSSVSVTPHSDWWALGISSVQFPLLLQSVRSIDRSLEKISLGNLISAQSVEGITASITMAESPGHILDTAAVNHDERLWISDAGFRLPGASCWSSFLTKLKLGAPTKVVCDRYGCFIEDEYLHKDICELGMPPSLARSASAELILSAQVAWEAVTSAGAFERHSKRQIGVFVGIQAQKLYGVSDKSFISSAYSVNGQDPSSIAACLSSMFGISGAISTVTAACASSLVALSQAAASIQAGMITGAVVVGVQLNRDQHVWDYMSHLGILCPPGMRTMPLTSASVDSSTQGFHRGEGAVAVFVERAPEPPTSISCVLNSCQTGFVGQPGAPHVIDTARAASLMSVATHGENVDHVEMHAAGTLVGDALEMEALELSSLSLGSHAVQLGLTKGAYGHTEGCSGLVSLCAAWATLLGVDSRSHKVIPSTAVLRPILKPKSAMISNFGFTGTGVCVKLSTPEDAGRSTGSQMMPETQQAIVCFLPGNTSGTRSSASMTKIIEAIEFDFSAWQHYAILQLSSRLAYCSKIPQLACILKPGSIQAGQQQYIALPELPGQLRTTRIYVHLREEYDATYTTTTSLGFSMDAIDMLAQHLIQVFSIHGELDGLSRAAYLATGLLVQHMLPAWNQLQAILLSMPASLEQVEVVCDSWLGSITASGALVDPTTFLRAISAAAVNAFLPVKAHILLRAPCNTQEPHGIVGHSVSSLKTGGLVLLSEGHTPSRRNAARITLVTPVGSFTNKGGAMSQLYQQTCASECAHRRIIISTPTWTAGDLQLYSSGVRLTLQTGQVLDGAQALAIWIYANTGMAKASVNALMEPLVVEWRRVPLYMRAKWHTQLHGMFFPELKQSSQPPTRQVSAAPMHSKAQAKTLPVASSIHYEKVTRAILAALEIAASHAPLSSPKSSTTDIDPDVSFIEALGLDSIACLTLPQALSQAFGRAQLTPPNPIPSTLAYNFPTVSALVSFCSTEKNPVSTCMAPKEAHTITVAIYGLGTLLPGGVLTPQEGMLLLQRGKEVPTSPQLPVWKQQYLTSSSRKQNMQMPGKWLSDEQWDHVMSSTAHLSALQLHSTDPQHHAVLYVARQAFLEAQEKFQAADAQLNLSRIGCIVGCTCHDFIGTNPASLNPHFAAGSQTAMLAGKVSRELNLGGAAVVVDTACSSGIVALHSALSWIRQGVVDGVIVAAVNLPLLASVSESLGCMGVLSVAGHMAPCTTNASGYVRADGAVAFFLHKDDVKCPSFGTCWPIVINHNGTSASLTAPSGAAQQSMLRQVALELEFTPPDHLELHSSSTIVGDGIEYMKNSESELYDMIIVDGSDPVGPAEGLFTVEFYTNCHKALNEKGILVAQGESPKFNENAFAELHQTIKGIFGDESAHVALFYVPTYPTGMWSFQFGLKDAEMRITDIYEPEVEEFVKKNNLQYYNADIHNASLALPNFVKSILNNE